MSDGASPSPCLTLNAISPTAVRRVFSADEAVAASATSASVDKTAIERLKPLGTSIDPTTHEVLALRTGRHKPPLTAQHTGRARRGDRGSHLCADPRRAPPGGGGRPPRPCRSVDR